MSASTTVVTGAEGFVGAWLRKELPAHGREIVATRRRGPLPPTADRGEENLRWVIIDLSEADQVDELIRTTRPGQLVHLAAVALSRAVNADPLHALRVNFSATHHLLRAVARHTPATRVLAVSTGEVYGPRPLGSPPLGETSPLRPPSLYAATKAAAELCCLQRAEDEGLDLVVARPLNHSGPGRPPDYAESSFARQLAHIEQGEQEPVLRVGNLEDVRDFSDVRDVVRAYLHLLERGERGGIYNVCSGRGWRLGDVLTYLVSRSPAEPRIEVDPARYRPSRPESCAIVGDPSRLHALGWLPRYRFEQTLDALLEFWRAEP
ncbi:MAG: NAD-dependent epimerase/dehydratase family protein [Myxococcota bacterium]